MTLPGADGPAPELGHRSPEASAPGADHMMKMDDSQAMPDQGDAAPAPKMSMHSLTLTESLLWITATFLLLIGAVWLTAQWVPISFSGI